MSQWFIIMLYIYYIFFSYSYTTITVEYIKPFMKYIEVVWIFQVSQNIINGRIELGQIRLMYFREMVSVCSLSFALMMVI